MNKLIIGYDISPIQLISLLFLRNSNSGIFFEINAGEGKFFIKQLFAAYLALTGKIVDAISRGSVLGNLIIINQLANDFPGRSSFHFFYYKF